MHLGILVMSNSNLTRWIEDAEARQVLETAMVGRGWVVSERHYLHLGATIAKVPCWSHQPIGGSLASFGSHALARFRHSLSPKHH
jgi:hypothetical protein